MALYRELHAAPELAMTESKTAARLAPELRKLGYEVTEKVGETGIVAVMRNGPGKTVLVRADMDGLPLEEKTGLPFASKVRTKARSGVDTGGHARLRPRHPHDRADRHRPPPRRRQGASGRARWS